MINTNEVKTMSEDNINKLKNEIKSIQDKIESLEADYIIKKESAHLEAKSKLEALQSTKGKEVENFKNDLDKKQKAVDETTTAVAKAKEELKLAKQVFKTENSEYNKELKDHDKEVPIKLKSLDSELKNLIKKENSKIKTLEKQIHQEEKELEKFVVVVD